MCSAGALTHDKETEVSVIGVFCKPCGCMHNHKCHQSTHCQAQCMLLYYVASLAQSNYFMHASISEVVTLIYENDTQIVMYEQP